MQCVTLAKLIKERQLELGGVSLRDLERRAAERGYRISTSSLSAYAAERRTAVPKMPTIEALSAALGVSLQVVEAAAKETAAAALTSPDDGSPTPGHVRTWMILTENRTDEEKAHLLSVVRTVLQGLDAARPDSRPAQSGE
jgi:hypothetical protein